MNPSIQSITRQAGSLDYQSCFQMGSRTLGEVKSPSPAATAVTDFIQARFEQCYGARPQLNIPQLLTLTRHPGRLAAAVGVRDASEDGLFLESYLPEPIESYLPDGNAKCREGIAEIAHLAGVEPGVSRYLFPLLTRWLMARGFDWITFTGTAQLRNGFERMNIPTRTLAVALPEKLPGGGKGWGSYYAHQPLVMMVCVSEGQIALEQLGLLQRIHAIADGGENCERIA